MSRNKQAFMTASFMATNRSRIPGLNFQATPAQVSLAFAYAEQAYPRVRQLLSRVGRMNEGERQELWQTMHQAFSRVKQEQEV